MPFDVLCAALRCSASFDRDGKNYSPVNAISLQTAQGLIFRTQQRVESFFGVEGCRDNPHPVLGTFSRCESLAERMWNVVSNGSGNMGTDFKTWVAKNVPLEAAIDRRTRCNVHARPGCLDRPSLLRWTCG